MHLPGAPPKFSSHEDNDSNNTTTAAPTETRNEEPTADETMKKISTVIFLHFLSIKLFGYLRIDSK
jgi:hypothetical protein